MHTFAICKISPLLDNGKKTNTKYDQVCMESIDRMTNIDYTWAMISSQ